MLGIRGLAIRAYNTAHRLLRPYSGPESNCAALREIDDRAARLQTDISDHLPTIFCETLAAHPRLIVELGVRDGESRFALERAARLGGSALISVDINDCASACITSSQLHFVQYDDLRFADVFPSWCSERGIEPSIDVLFIDTSHVYEHTCQEIKAWFPHLSAKCKVIFHDTNLRNFVRRRDGTIGTYWDGKRSVIRAIEDQLGTRFNERADFVTVVNEWLVRHRAHCNGLTILERLPHAIGKGKESGSISPEVSARTRASSDGKKDSRLAEKN